MVNIILMSLVSGLLQVYLFCTCCQLSINRHIFNVIILSCLFKSIYWYIPNVHAKSIIILYKAFNMVHLIKLLSTVGSYQTEGFYSSNFFCVFIGTCLCGCVIVKYIIFQCLFFGFRGSMLLNVINYLVFETTSLFI